MTQPGGVRWHGFYHGAHRHGRAGSCAGPGGADQARGGLGVGVQAGIWCVWRLKSA